MMMFWRTSNPLDTAVRYRKTGTAAAASSGSGTSLTKRYHPVAVYDMTVNQHQAEYLARNRKGT